jgi:hypothetical protein
MLTMEPFMVTLETWRLTEDIEAHPGAVEAHCGALYAHPQLYFAINIIASSCHSSCDAIPLKKPNLVKNYSKFREISTIFV